ncbi:MULTISPECIES: winged helix-turn-helix transcriptional regulator [Prevotella]|uniref:Transcriptional regulator n=1 Tax=Prevotella herbatica TaxID=2801997 RepID=A0ABM7NXL1_9BACT|nr:MULTISPECIES: helix-turn-helix domain-containing protein [Prevotella]MDN5553728.1 helix-turn-helix transcriptional regulator [Prevotella sp.]BCS85258.1 transcriptional regulator [Prevotella herbatica]
MQKKEKIVNPEYLTCPIRNVLAKFGDKWSLLVLYHLYVAENGVMRFNELRRNMTDCSQKMLSQTLKNLESNNLVNRKLYPEVPPRVEYSLTDIGKSLMPSLDGLIKWAKENFNNVVTA